MNSTVTPDFCLQHFSQLDREVESKQGAVDFLGRESRDQRSGLQRCLDLQDRYQRDDSARKRAQKSAKVFPKGAIKMN